jgi:hypothetical protein
MNTPSLWMGRYSIRSPYSNFYLGSSSKTFGFAVHLSAKEPLDWERYELHEFSRRKEGNINIVTLCLKTSHNRFITVEPSTCRLVANQENYNHDNSKFEMYIHNIVSESVMDVSFYSPSTKKWWSCHEEQILVNETKNRERFDFAIVERERKIHLTLTAYEDTFSKRTYVRDVKVNDGNTKIDQYDVGN